MTWAEDCDRAVARAQCGQRGEPACLQLGCRRCAQDQILTTQFEYGVIANAIGKDGALKAAVEEIGKLRAHIGRMAEGEREIDLWRRSIASGGAVSPADVEAMDADAAADEVTCVYCGGSEHETESPAGEECLREQERDRHASRADRIADEARDREAGL